MFSYLILLQIKFFLYLATGMIECVQYTIFFMNILIVTFVIIFYLMQQGTSTVYNYIFYMQI